MIIIFIVIYLLKKMVINGEKKWDKLEEYHRYHCLHHYRDHTESNRHGHSNKKPSYWAKGFARLDLYKAAVTTEEFAEYCKVHSTCCGVDRL